MIRRILCSVAFTIAIVSPAVAATVQTIDITEKKSKPMVIGHRGMKKSAPENTMAAFKAAMEQGAEAIELDIHKARTGEIVVIHDADVARTTDGTGSVPDMTWEQLQKVSAGSRFGPEFASERIPLLSDVLKLVNGKIVINIEVKNWPKRYPGIDDDLIAMLKTYPYPDKIVISSFDHELLRSIHDKAPQYKLAVLDSAILLDPKDYATKIGATYWHPDFHTLRADVVQRARNAGLKVNVWTVNKPDEWAEAINMGVDGICTDDPKGLATYLSTTK